eukprot:523390-Prymnesium_polylepis.2
MSMRGRRQTSAQSGREVSARRGSGERTASGGGRAHAAGAGGVRVAGWGRSQGGRARHDYYGGQSARREPQPPARGARAPGAASPLGPLGRAQGGTCTRVRVLASLSLSLRRAEAGGALYGASDRLLSVAVGAACRGTAAVALAPRERARRSGR